MCRAILLIAIGSLSCQAAFCQGFTPSEAVKRMQTPDGFSVRLIAAEPEVRQPLSISFDAKGRLWVLQYLQYPNPAGLKPIKQDQYLRTIWDRIPEPPPHGPKGLDKITIYSEPDENGRFRKTHDFITGLNLASGFCLGQGGVFVVQPPYLLFYPDKNNDDLPDGDPEVLLTGFGMEDSHSYANSLQWGPDGWLYGAHGSTVTAKITNPADPKSPPIEFQQGVWRYHPISKRFELFAEGGGNTFGLDFDRYGRCIAGTNWGGKAMLHHVQGAYYIKGFSKHGPLHNPHAYGYFDHVPYENFKGGHVTCGGVLYEANLYPEEYRGQYLAGNLLSHAIYWHKMTPQGSSFTAKHGGDLLLAHDTWFRPVDTLVGPDGCLYIADWYDKRAAHLDPIDNWDKTNGRIYRLEYGKLSAEKPVDLNRLSSEKLVNYLQHPNKWWRNEARRILGERREKSIANTLRKWLQEDKDLFALEAFWTLNLCHALEEKDWVTAFHHPCEHVRAWAIRLLGDDFRLPESFVPHIKTMLAKEKSLTVLSQVACTAKRLPVQQAVILLEAIWKSTEAHTDPQIPLLTWWAIEAHAMHGREQIVELWKSPLVWKSSLFETTLISRVGRRYASENQNADWKTLAELVAATPHEAATVRLLQGINEALQSTHLRKVPEPFQKTLKQLQSKNLPIVRELAARMGDPEAIEQLHRLTLTATESPEKINAIRLLTQLGDPRMLPLLRERFQRGTNDSIRLAALEGLGRFDDPTVADDVLELYGQLSGNLRNMARSFLLSRSHSAEKILLAVDQKKIPSTEFSLDQLRPLKDFKNEKIDQLIRKHWGEIAPATAGEKQARISWLNIALSKGEGNPKEGKILFEKNCAVCHMLFGQGAKIGPDLTTADRKNRNYLLTHIVDPSLYIRPEYLASKITTTDGRTLVGLVKESSGENIEIVNIVENKEIRTSLAKNLIDEIVPSKISLMPEKLLDSLTDDQVRHLFAYLQLSEPQEKSPPPSEGKPAEKKLRVLLISGSLEYKSDETLAILQKHLETNYPVECWRAFRKSDNELPGLAQLEKCDVAVFFTRRLTVEGDDLELIKKYAARGKPIVGIRTASHGFQKWLEMDKEVFGGNYKGHYKEGPLCETQFNKEGESHPVLQGVKPFKSFGSLYKNPEIAKDVTVLMNGSNGTQTEPVTWVRLHNKGRVFYTSLGHQKDFEESQFLKLLTNAIFWTAGRDIPK